jgi:hypothetical protein
MKEMEKKNRGAENERQERIASSVSAGGNSTFADSLGGHVR